MKMIFKKPKDIYSKLKKLNFKIIQDRYHLRAIPMIGKTQARKQQDIIRVKQLFLSYYVQ